MNILIEVESAAVETREGVKDGKAWQIREQKAYLKLPHFKYPQQISLRLNEQNQPYAVGVYNIDSTSFYLDKFRKLQLGRLSLIPAVAANTPRPAPLAAPAAAGVRA